MNIKDHLDSLPEPERAGEVNRIFASLWPPLVDLLRYMEVPFLMTAQFDPDEDPNKPDLDKLALAYLMGNGVGPRLVFATVMAREGFDGMRKVFPGFDSPLERVTDDKDVIKKIAVLQATDAPMGGLAMPLFMDTMRKLQSGGEEPGAEGALSN